MISNMIGLEWNGQMPEWRHGSIRIYSDGSGRNLRRYGPTGSRTLIYGMPFRYPTIGRSAHTVNSIARNNAIVAFACIVVIPSALLLVRVVS